MVQRTILFVIVDIDGIEVAGAVPTSDRFYLILANVGLTRQPRSLKVVVDEE